MRVRPHCVALLVLLLAGWASHARAQSGGNPDARFGELESNVPGTYYHAEPGEATIQVIVWGTVANRGRYQIPQGSTLGELIALAGGPVMQARSRQTRREITITISRKNSTGREIVYRLEGEELIETEVEYPTLRDRDIVTVEMVQWNRFTVRDLLNVLGSLASLALIADRVFRF